MNLSNISAIVSWCVGSIVFTVSAVEPFIEQWHPVDLSFTTTTTYTNPFMDIFLDATFSGPGNATLTIPGFYIGNNTWKIRFAPTKTGIWRYVTSSSDTKLNNVADSITCVANTSGAVHGRLFVDSLNTHHFRYEDGTPYFMMGGEINWLGLIQCSDSTLAKTKQIIDMYAAHGFTLINMNGYAWDTSWKPGISSTDDFGPPDMYAWQGTNAAPDQTRLNTAFWTHLDKVIDYMYQKNMVVYIYFKVYNKAVTWPTIGTKNDSLYFTTIVARYQAYPNIIWSFAKEAYNETNQAYIHKMLDLIGSKDAYKRLRTIHDDVGTGSTNDYAADASLNTNIDFRTSQLHTQAPNLYAVTLSQRNAKSWPVYNAESGYEIGNDGGHTYSSVQTKEEVLKRMYKIVMAGAYPAYYYTYHAWDVVRTGEEPNGLNFYQYLSSFITKTKWYNLVPSDNLLSADTTNHCLAKAGSEYIVYLSNGGTTTLTIANVTGQLQGTWLNAYTGIQQQAGTFTNGSRLLTSPWTATPSLLWIHTATGNITAIASPVKNSNCLTFTNNQIQVQLTHDATAHIELVGLNGCRVATVFSGRLSTNRYSFGVKNYRIPSGMYLAVLTEQGAVSQTKIFIDK